MIKNNSQNKTEHVAAEKNPQRLLILVGAGASATLGYPLLDEVLFMGMLQKYLPGYEIIKDISERIPTTGHTGAILEDVIGKLREYKEIGNKLRNDIFLKKHIGNITPALYTYDEICTTALNSCFRLLFDKYSLLEAPPNINEIQRIINIYKELSLKNKDSELHVFTTNYDCSFQVLANHCNNGIFYSHIDPKDGYKYKPNHWFSISKKEPEVAEFKIFIHRLHGCINWFPKKNASDIIFNDDDYNDEEVQIIEYSMENGVEKAKIPDGLLNKMFIKTTTANVEILGLEPFATAFRNFNQHLKKAEALFVWGFSFRDQEVLRSINDACSYNKLKIFYYDPFLQEAMVQKNITGFIKSLPGVSYNRYFKPKRISSEIEDSVANFVKENNNSVKEINVNLAED